MADFDWPVAPDPEPPPIGKCTLGYFRAQCVERFARRIIEVLFKIIEPTDHAGKIVKKYYSIPMNEPPGLESNYYRDWTLANGVPPRRNDRMTPHVFKGYWHAELGQTKQRAVRDKGKGGVRPLRDGEVGRIVVENLIERIAGAARH